MRNFSKKKNKVVDLVKNYEFLLLLLLRRGTLVPENTFRPCGRRKSDMADRDGVRPLPRRIRLSGAVCECCRAGLFRVLVKRNLAKGIFRVAGAEGICETGKNIGSIMDHEEKFRIFFLWEKEEVLIQINWSDVVYYRDSYLNGP